MNDSTNEKILQQLIEVFRGPIAPYDALVFSLQLLCWAKISNNPDMPDALKIQAQSFADTQWVGNVWGELSRRPGKIGIAYLGGKVPAPLEPSTLGAAIRLCLQLVETGVLGNFDPTESITQVLGRESGELFLPTELAIVMTALAEIKKGSCVYNPWDSAAQLAAQALNRGSSAYVETLHDPRLPALISVFAAREIDIAHGDPIRNPSAVVGGKLREFDSCVSFPPLGLRYTAEVIERDWYDRFQDRRSSGAVLSVRHIMAQTTGKAVIAVPYSLLFSPGGEKALREDLINKGSIAAVISMPAGLLVNTTIAFALLVLDMKTQHNTIRFINADTDDFRESIPRVRARVRLVNIEGIVSRATGKITDDLVAEVPVKEVIANDYILQINRYVLPGWQRKIEKVLMENETALLGDLVSMIRSAPLGPGNHMVNAWEVLTSDLPDTGYIVQPTKEVQVDKSNSIRRHLFLRPYDVLLIFKGNVGRVGIVPPTVPEPGRNGWLAGQSAVVLRINDPKKMDPRALAIYLRSPLGQRQLEAISVQGATIPMIQLRELQKLPVIIPSNKEATEIGNVLDEQARIQNEIEKLKEKQLNLANKFWTLD